VSEFKDVVAALNADGEELTELVSELDADRWALPTPAPGWTIAHQIAHLAAVFRIAGLAAADPAKFQAMASQLSPDFDANVAVALQEYLVEPPPTLLARWRAELTTAVGALAVADPDKPVPWLVRPLPPAVLASAGMLELFAHGQDIADALGVRRPRTDRIRYLVGFAVRTWDFGYLARGLTPPEVEFRYELTAPSGALWTFGPEDAEQRITGPAEDFCLLVTRRRHRDDLAVTATGPDADHWLSIAQAYRGSAGEGRQPGQFAEPTAA
jgi:uncharacterized protein (TIGR03084 family)